MFLEELASRRHLVLSYFYTVNLTLVLSLARLLESRGEEVCIIHDERIRWNLAPFTVNLKCSPNSVNLVFEAESELEVPKDFLLVTSNRNLKLHDATTLRLSKVKEGIFMALGEGAKFTFRISANGVEDYEERKSDVIKILEELGGEATLQDIVNISSKRLNLSREMVREELGFLARTGKIVIKKNVVRLA
ncbi:hypothetical protein [Metallosphaera hakonensis]|uniref:Uncharacterized protein n=1 Tax=Metallosphaera hakonensis JCM 8857 = DSM 7519 TaxID=1293036 RepID=A0A2U9IUT1_9CREN|nr:hypothetical protein [Metallosphaera hakonensis]AWR99774.1 hypothetical protein DFR87_08800 [Metallosphaera hakonensis JCM 8857 = DSM 7519]